MPPRTQNNCRALLTASTFYCSFPTASRSDALPDIVEHHAVHLVDDVIRPPAPVESRREVMLIPRGRLQAGSAAGERCQAKFALARNEEAVQMGRMHLRVRSPFLHG